MIITILFLSIPALILLLLSVRLAWNGVAGFVRMRSYRVEGEWLDHLVNILLGMLLPCVAGFIIWKAVS